jgi:hypothetical protein
VMMELRQEGTTKGGMMEKCDRRGRRLRDGDHGALALGV